MNHQNQPIKIENINAYKYSREKVAVEISESVGNLREPINASLIL